MPYELTITRGFPASREVLWTALTDPAILSTWYWPEAFEATWTLDLRDGGRWRVESEAADMAAQGLFTAVEPPERIAYTWKWDDEDIDTHVTMHLMGSTDDGAGAAGPSTQCVLSHFDFETEHARDDHIQGWNDCLDRLETQLTHRSATR